MGKLHFSKTGPLLVKEERKKTNNCNSPKIRKDVLKWDLIKKGKTKQNRTEQTTEAIFGGLEGGARSERVLVLAKLGVLTESYLLSSLIRPCFAQSTAILEVFCA